MEHSLRLGFLVNPYAGLGGPLAKKGSDDNGLAKVAVADHWALSALLRAQVFLKEVAAQPNLDIQWVSLDGVMGGDCLLAAGFDYIAVPCFPAVPTTASDTHLACDLMTSVGVDLMVFVGGDGTARDVLNALPKGQLAVGVPAGVKMQSGVYAITPQSAADLIVQMANGELIRIGEKEVRDIDEQAFREGIIKSHYYGDMTTLDAPQYIQHVKQGGLEVEVLVILDIAEHLKSTMPKNALMIFGPGSTTQGVLNEWGVESTLLGVDIVLGGECCAVDVDAETLNNYVDKHSGPVFIVLTIIGGQGHIIGRGNQQISAQILERVGRKNLRIIATKTKLQTLGGRPLLIDSGNPVLDKSWVGYISVITGYEDEVMYRVGFDNQKQDLNSVVVAECYKILMQAAQDYACSKDKSIRRLVHGRGGCYRGIEHITLDAFNDCVLLTIFKAPDDGFDVFFDVLGEFLSRMHKHKLMVQRRDLPGTPYKMYGVENVPSSLWVSQSGLDYQLRFNAQNTGFFLDMEAARDWLKSRVKGRRVLNLFAYTCAFSVVAMANGASACTNVDMSSRALSWGRDNHRRNNIATDSVHFLALNILKSWSRIKKYGPYDIIILDPPSFQKGSFIASKDYGKLVKRIAQLAAPNADVLACLNAPELGAEFLLNLFSEHWTEGSFVQRLNLTSAFKDVDIEKQLKVIHFSAGSA